MAMSVLIGNHALPVSSSSPLRTIWHSYISSLQHQYIIWALQNLAGPCHRVGVFMLMSDAFWDSQIGAAAATKCNAVSWCTIGAALCLWEHLQALESILVKRSFSVSSH